MAFCVKIIFQPEIVFDVFYFRDFPKVSIFKSGIKNKYVLLLRYEYFKLRIAEISLHLKPWKIFINKFILVAIKVPFLSFFRK